MGRKTFGKTLRKWGQINTLKGLAAVGHTPFIAGRPTHIVMGCQYRLTLAGERKGNHLSETQVGGSEKILLVEDDPPVRAVAHRGLSRYGYSVLPAESGSEALRLAEEHEGTIDLLLTDIMMPGMNGVEVGAEILKRYPGIKVLYMSGYADQDLVRQGLLKPGTRFLQKPFTPGELAERVREVLDGADPGSVGSRRTKAEDGGG